MNLLPFCFVVFVSLISSVEGQQGDNLQWRVKKVETLLTGVMATLDTLNSTDAELAEAVTNTSTKITDLVDDLRNVTLTLAEKDGEITESLKTLKSTGEELDARDKELENKIETSINSTQSSLTYLRNADLALTDAVKTTNVKIKNLHTELRNQSHFLAGKDKVISDDLFALKTMTEDLGAQEQDLQKNMTISEAAIAGLQAALKTSRAEQEKMRGELDGWNAKFTDHFVTMPGEITYAIQSTTYQGNSHLTADKAYDDDPGTQSHTIYEASPWYRAWLAREVRILSFTINMYSHYTTDVYTIYTLGEDGTKTRCASFKPGTGQHTQIIGCGLTGHGFEIAVYNGGSNTYLRMYDLKLQILLI